MPKDYLLEPMFRDLIESHPEFQGKRAESLADGWQRYVTVAKHQTEDGCEFVNIPVLS